MFYNDPTLYGATLPYTMPFKDFYKDFPVQMQMPYWTPWQNFPRYDFPRYDVPKFMDQKFLPFYNFMPQTQMFHPFFTPHWNVPQLPIQQFPIQQPWFRPF